jgi:hypothetical protein
VEEKRNAYRILVRKPEGLGFGGGSKLGIRLSCSLGKKLEIEKNKYIRY